LCMCDMYVASDICSWYLCVVIGCGFGVERLSVPICQYGYCVNVYVWLCMCL